MLYNVSQLLMEPTGSTRRFPLDEPLPPAPDAVGAPDAAGRATGTVRLLRTHHGLLINANIQTHTPADCARCLTPYYRASTLTLEEECYPTTDPSTGRKMSPPDEAEGVVHIDGRQMLDLSEVIRQYLLADQPLKSLCRPDCRGLCHQCGADRNTQICQCAAPTDPRWGALAGLLPPAGQ